MGAQLVFDHARRGCQHIHLGCAALRLKRPTTIMSYLGVKSGLRLLHLGVPLTHGMLVDYGVGPGSIIDVVGA